MVARREVQGGFQFPDLSVKAPGRPGIEILDGGHRVDQVAQVDHKSHIPPVQVTNHMAHAPVGQFVDREGRIAVPFVLIEM